MIIIFIGALAMLTVPRHTIFLIIMETPPKEIPLKPREKYIIGLTKACQPALNILTVSGAIIIQQVVIRLILIK